MHELLGGLVRVPEHEDVAHCETVDANALAMTTPPTARPGRMLPDRIGETIQVPCTSAKAATPAVRSTASRST
ncbi:MAG: hypothetical protein ACLQCU_11030 [Acidimicrobiales bacterium]